MKWFWTSLIALELTVWLILLILVAGCAPQPQWETRAKPAFGIVKNVFENDSHKYAEVNLKSGKFLGFTILENDEAILISDNVGKVKAGDSVSIRVRQLVDHRGRILKQTLLIIDVAKDKESLLDKIKRKLD